MRCGLPYVDMDMHRSSRLWEEHVIITSDTTLYPLWAASVVYRVACMPQSTYIYDNTVVYKRTHAIYFVADELTGGTDHLSYMSG